LGSIEVSRYDVFITNIVKCRPPNNRAPRKAEIEACNPYMMSQIRLVKPRIVCPLGTPAIATVLGEESSATRAHGKPQTKGNVTILPMYHPAAALYDASLKEVLASDFMILKELLEAKATVNKPVKDNGHDHAQGRQTLEKWV